MSRKQNGGPKAKAKGEDVAPASPLMTIEETAVYLRVSRNTAYTEAKAGNLPIHRVRKRILVIRPLLEEMILNRKREGGGQD